MLTVVSPPAQGGIEPRDWSDAMNVQDACNLAGVVRSFAEVMPKIWHDVIKEGGGTKEVNAHPIAVMYSSKISSMTGEYEHLVFAKAHEAVVQKIREHGAFAP